MVQLFIQWHKYLQHNEGERRGIKEEGKEGEEEAPAVSGPFCGGACGVFGEGGE